ncbi:MAG: flavin reductase family protein [Chitinophagaceae bacterium]
MELQHIDKATIASWDRFYRANAINALVGVKPVSLIGTISTAGVPNVAVFSSIVHLGSNPALIGYINRPRAAAPDTLANIEATGVYTINHIHASFVAQAHQTSAKYPSEVDEFDAVGLTPIYRKGCIAPFVQESMLQYQLQLVEIVPIQHNGTFLVIGSVENIWLPHNALQADGFIDVASIGAVSSSGNDAYYTTQLLQRFAYAKP